MKTFTGLAALLLMTVSTWGASTINPTEAYS